MGRRKKKKTEQAVAEDDSKVPKSFVFRRGKCGFTVLALVDDVRKVMRPNTATNLKESKKNQMKDFLSIGPSLGITHFLVFNQTMTGTNLRVVRIPRGPTITFRVLSYSLMKDIAQLQKRPHSPSTEYNQPPLIVLNNFGGNERHKQLLAAMFQNLFPPLDVQTIALKDCRRVLLLHLEESEEVAEDEGSSEDDDESDSDGDGEQKVKQKKQRSGLQSIVEWRHYLITAAPVGLSKPIKRVIKARIPDLSKLADISEYITNANQDGAGWSSDSEAEDTEENRLTLAQKFVGRGNSVSQKSAIRLKEVGPRMRLGLVKIEQDFCGGPVLHHSFVTRSKSDAAALKKKKDEKTRVRKLRKDKQAANVSRKEAAKKLQKKKKRRQDGSESDDAGDARDDVDDDAAWYEAEVGEVPDPDTFRRGPKRAKKVSVEDVSSKKTGNEHSAGGSTFSKPKVQPASKRSKKRMGQTKRDAAKDAKDGKRDKKGKGGRGGGRGGARGRGRGGRSGGRGRGGKR